MIEVLKHIIACPTAKDMLPRSFLPSRHDLAARLKDNVKLLLGAIVYPVQSRRWRRFVRGNAVLYELAQRYPRIRHKIYRPYLSGSLTCSDRVDVLIGHYSHIFRAGLGDLTGEAASLAVPLAEFTGKTGAAFHLRLSAINIGHREGELTLKLMREEECLYSVSFALISSHDAPSIALGALQGLRSSNGADVIKTVTRELHGCRPKKLMVSVVRAIGVSLGCSRLLLVSNKNRIAVNGRRASRISSNYDETWEEMGAERRADGNFELPCADPGQNFALISSNKRAEARRRSALVRSVCVAVQSNLNGRKVNSAYSLGRITTTPIPLSSRSSGGANTSEKWTSVPDPTVRQL